MVDYQTLFAKANMKIYSDIYNYSELNLKNNIKLAILNNGRPVRGMLYNNILITDTPDEDYYWYLFEVDSSHLSNLLTRMAVWTNFEDVLNDNKINIDLITYGKRQIPSILAYYKSDMAGRVVIAINSLVYLKFGETNHDTHLVIHYDSDVPNNRTLISHIPDNHENYVEIVNRFYSTPHYQMLLLLNGYYHTPASFLLSGNPTTDYYELYVDENIVFEQTIDLVHRNNYISSEEGLYKDIILLDRTLTFNHVYTYDTIFLSVHANDGRGICLPYLATHSVSSLTHSCIGVSSYLVDATLDILGVTTGKINVRVCNYNKNNELTPNGCLTEKLYIRPDSFIMEALLGDPEIGVSSWTANNLESSSYAKTLTNFTSISNYHQDLIRKQIECLGYYGFEQCLLTNTGEIRDLGAEVSHINIAVPSFWEGTEVFPILYLDGFKIPHVRYTISRIDVSTISVDFQVPVIPLNSHSVLSYQLILQEHQGSYSIVPSNSSANITVPIVQEGISIFLKTNDNINSVDGQLPGYLKLPNHNTPYYGYGESSGNCTLSFNGISYGREFVIVQNNQVNYTILHNLDISSGSTIAILPSSILINNTGAVPVLTPQTYEIYLNTRLLVPNLDYVIKRLSDGDIVAGYQIIIQNLNLLNDSSPNSLEIYQTSHSYKQLDTGYVISGIIPKSTSNEALISGISRLFINGKLVPTDKIQHLNTHYQIDPTWYSQANTYCMILGVSTDFYDAYALYEDPDYFIGREQISAYDTALFAVTYPEPLVIPYMHKVYSPYLNEIIRRIIGGSIEVNFINDDSDILAQVISYDYLKEFDLLHINPELDARFTDSYPTFVADLTITDLNQYRYIQRLVKLYLGADIDTDHSTVYLGN